MILVACSTFVSAQGNKPIVAVASFESSFSNYDSRNIQTAIETALSKTQKFTLMERGRLDSLLAEQGLSANGLVAGSGEIGGFSGVDYLIYGRVTQLGLEAKNVLIMSACEAQLGLDVRVVDVKTGEIRLSENISADDQVNTAGAEENPCNGVGISAFDNLTATTARKLAEKLTQTLFPVKLAKVSSDEVYLNYGEGFLNSGEILKVVSLGEGFEDPDTGEIIGAEEELLAIVKVTKLRPKYSIASILMQAGDLNRGDVANRLSKKAQKKAQKVVKSCTSAIKRVTKSCKKDGKKCDKAREKKATSCALN
tara:strand:- start:217 stop:1146 length:930 start_codon:yes stop_codon:yes gene_type:complete